MTSIILTVLPFFLQIAGYFFQYLVKKGVVKEDDLKFFYDFCEYMNKKNIFRIKLLKQSEVVRDDLQKEIAEEKCRFDRCQ